MPNWCHNNLTIYCKNTEQTKKYLKDLVTAAKSEVFNEFIISYSDMGLEEWDYNSCIEHWGTKWDISFSGEYETINDKNISVTISYDTAWAPNTPVLDRLYEKLCELDEDVTVESTYEEPGMGFCGRFINGSDEAYDIGIAHNLMEHNLEEVSLINSEDTIKLSSDESIFFIEKSREGGSDYSPIHDEHIQYEEIVCFSNYYNWGDGEVTLIKWDDEYFIL